MAGNYSYCRNNIPLVLFPGIEASFDFPISVIGYPGGRENYEAGYPLKEMFKTVSKEEANKAKEKHLIVYPP